MKYAAPVRASMGKGQQMDNELFNDMDPWERIMMMQQRVEQLEAINKQIIDAITIQRHRADLAEQGIQNLQKFIMEKRI